jgi:hypothetical protein
VRGDTSLDICRANPEIASTALKSERPLLSNSFFADTYFTLVIVLCS